MLIQAFPSSPEKYSSRHDEEMRQVKNAGVGFRVQTRHRQEHVGWFTGEGFQSLRELVDVVVLGRDLRVESGEEGLLREGSIPSPFSVPPSDIMIHQCGVSVQYRSSSRSVHG
uniref:Uncharacterized protein n=1 Tax=Branchiostoma floridae TaxID=7739 RepID=C3ZUS5_BRAFL|eukprot:XP_002587776.1 hypothetical protein BRAFLDRAFT_94679 [Branchiostoma floridae]